MKAPKKSNTALKRLPEARQEEIVNYCQVHSDKETIAWLKADGVTTNARQLADLFTFRMSRKKHAQREARILERVNRKKKSDARLTLGELNRYGEMLFNQIAIDEEDIKKWTLAQEVRFKRQTQSLQAKKVALEFQKYKDQSKRAAEVVRDDDMTFEEKEAAMKQILGIEP